MIGLSEKDKKKVNRNCERKQFPGRGTAAANDSPGFLENTLFVCNITRHDAQVPIYSGS